MSYEHIHRGAWLIRDAVEKLGDIPLKGMSKESRSVITDTIRYLNIQAARLECSFSGNSEGDAA